MQLILGDMYNYYRNGENHEMAFHWYQKSADLGYAEGQQAVGHMYQHGFGVKQDDEQVFYWYQKSANQGDIAGIHRFRGFVPVWVWRKTEL